MNAKTLPALSEDEAFEIGVEAWIYLYPLVLMELTRRVMSNVAVADGLRLRGPMNRFVHAPAYPDADFKDVVRPNADTLYSLLWYDVGAEPLLLTLPDSPERYHLLPLMDLWTDVYATLGTRTTGGVAGCHAVVGPRWQGALPEGVRAIRSPTEVGWIVGRVQSNGPADYDQVHRIQAQMQATPLSAWGRAAQGVGARVDPAVDMKTPPVGQASALSAADFFALAAELLKRNPPHAADLPMVMRMERLGLVVGEAFVLAAAAPQVRDALTRAGPAAMRHMLAMGPSGRLQRDGWSRPAAMIGAYGVDYLQRAFTAYRGLGALPPGEAVYPMALADAQGRPLDGRHRYRLHFDRERIPPAHAFWSLTMYGADQFFVANAINRYAIGDRDALQFNADGSLDLWIQHEAPASGVESNWLPAPRGPFSMNLRLYMPRAEALDGRWSPPPVERLS